MTCSLLTAKETATDRQTDLRRIIISIDDITTFICLFSSTHAAFLVIQNRLWPASVCYLNVQKSLNVLELGKKKVFYCTREQLLIGMMVIKIASYHVNFFPKITFKVAEACYPNCELNLNKIPKFTWIFGTDPFWNVTTLCWIGPTCNAYSWTKFL